MSRRGWRTVFNRRLVEGLTVDERIARLEGAAGRRDDRALAAMRLAALSLAYIEELQAAERRRQLPFYRRWFRKGSR